jgi:hypothetical protein
MKKIFTLSATLFLAIVLLSSCSKDRVIVHDNENYWLNQELGEVVYSDPSCSYWVVETYNGYNVVRSNYNNRPYEGDLIYGGLSSRGPKDLYNYSGKYVFAATVSDVWLTYGEALDVLDFYCPIYGKAGQTRVFKESTKIQKKK